ncbi:MAG: polysaccharide deacetylase family protein [Bacteroidetes bacterium]|nr:polysaccharide deacetylase family protein [Bacteroidota bacterium]
MKIGILNYTSSWKTISSQIGINFEEINLFHNNLDNFNFIIINRNTSNDENNILNRLLNNGTELLEIKNYFTKSDLYSKFVNSLHPSLFGDILYNQVIDFNSILYFYSNNSFFNIIKTKYSNIYQLGIDVDEFYTDTKTTRKNFYFSNSTRYPNETVASNSKYQIRQIIYSILLNSNFDLNSNKRQSIFTFRIDSDKSSEYQMFSLYEVLNKYDIKGTWFLDIKSHIHFFEKLLNYKKQELGIHCYEHNQFKNYNLRKSDIQKAISFFKNFNLKQNGISAPFGEWNNEINSIYEEFNFSYSSEFSLDYDNFPFYPILKNKFSNVLQIPIHPICIGSLRIASFSEKEMIKYYETIILNKFKMNEPICLYHHPTHGHHNVLEFIFDFVTKLGIPKLNYNTYSYLWKNNQLYFGCNKNFVQNYARNLSSTRQFSIRHKIQNYLESYYKLTP